MAIDINKLPEILRTGKIHGDGTKAILETPFARASFVALDKFENPYNQGDTPTKHSITLLFETDPKAPGAVDLKKAFIPYFEQTLKALRRPGRFEDGKCLVGDQKMYQTGERFSQEGKAYAGYTPTTVSLKSNYLRITLDKKTGEIKDDRGPVPCYNALGEEIEPKTIYSGCYVRAKFGIYKPLSFPKLSIILKSVQFVLDGERLGEEDIALEGIEGAEAAPTSGDFSSFVE